RASEAARQLPSLAACADRDALARVDSLPQAPEARRELAALRRDLDGLRVQGSAGFHARALPRLEEMVAALRGLGHRPTLAGALLLLGELRGTAGSFVAAREVLEEAVRVAEAGHDDETAAHAWNRLLYTEVQGMGLVKEAQRTARMAEAALERLGPEASLEVAAELRRVRSSLSYRRGEYARALEDATQALSLMERARGPQDVALADVLIGMGMALNALGRYAEAEQHYARALALVEAVYGHEHPLRAAHLSNVATALRLQGKVAEAVARYGEALALSERLLGAEHSSTSVIRVNLGDALSRQGLLAEALPHYERALASLRKGGDGEQPRVANVLLSLGNALADLGQLPRAEAAYREALALQEAELGPRHPDVALSRERVAQVHPDHAGAGVLRPEVTLGQCERLAVACHRLGDLPLEPQRGGHVAEVRRAQLVLLAVHRLHQRQGARIVPLRLRVASQRVEGHAHADEDIGERHVVRPARPLQQGQGFRGVREGARVLALPVAEAAAHAAQLRGHLQGGFGPQPLQGRFRHARGALGLLLQAHALDFRIEEAVPRARGRLVVVPGLRHTHRLLQHLARRDEAPGGAPQLAQQEQGSRQRGP
ncbi:MAG TPA: tetratricopeptide repeat protein, partial [Archangium sp.]